METVILVVIIALVPISLGCLFVWGSSHGISKVIGCKGYDSKGSDLHECDHLFQTIDLMSRRLSDWKFRQQSHENPDSDNKASQLDDSPMCPNDDVDPSLFHLKNENPIPLCRIVVDIRFSAEADFLSRKDSESLQASKTTVGKDTVPQDHSWQA